MNKVKSDYVCIYMVIIYNNVKLIYNGILCLYRWNSTYMMIEIFVLLEIKIRTIVEEDVALFNNYPSKDELLLLKNASEVINII